MAATTYASVVSLMQTIDRIMDHGHNLFLYDLYQLEFLQEYAAFLVDFLESYSNEDIKKVEANFGNRITDAAHAAEDTIENNLVDYILSPTLKNGASYIMYLMKEEAIQIKGKMELKVELPNHSIPSSSSNSLPVASKDIMVGFDDVLIQIMDRLTRQQSDPLTIIPISGMGGIGKTTLCKNVYANSYIVQYFDIRAWVTISQEYQVKEILSSLLIEFKVLSKEDAQEMDESELGVQIHKYLFGRRYLIVMDDVWSINVWNKVHLYFPENRKGSAVIITTRLTNMAGILGCRGVEVDFLDEDQSWDLLREKVFGQSECTIMLEEIGKKVAKNCKGLPLSIVVIAGLLAKSNMTQEYWNHVAEQVSSVVSQADDGEYSKILSLSYVNLPVHLKPCFLYMGVFPEDHEIQVSRLIGLWVAEGFLKLDKAKSLEEVAEEHLIELVNRNLILLHKRGSKGNMKSCKIHDLLRDLCLSEAHKENFIFVTGGRGLQDSRTLHKQRHIVIDFHNPGAISMPLLRSVAFTTELDSIPLKDSRLLRILDGSSNDLSEIVFNFVNLRYFDSSYWDSYYAFDLTIPVTINLLWNLQTLRLKAARPKNVPPEIWEMKQLRYFDVGKVSLPQPQPPPIAEQEDYNMKHMHTLLNMRNQTLSEEVVKKIPNIKRLKVSYDDFYGVSGRRKDFCFNNLQHLHNLKSLHICFEDDGFSDETHLLEHLVFPLSLEKLTLRYTTIPWEHMTKIGCLPNLQVLKLENNAFIGEEWEPIEEQFLSLKYLLIQRSFQLKFWNAESIHFPVLEQLLLVHMSGLEEIPIGIGEISTLRFINIECCSDSAVSSAIDILDEQENQGNADIKVKVSLLKNTTTLKNLEARNSFEVEYRDSLWF